MDALTLTFEILAQLKSRGHALHDVGTMSILTSPLEGRPGFYLSAVMQNRVPFDAHIADSMEAAVIAHTKFAIAADMYENGSAVRVENLSPLN